MGATMDDIRDWPGRAVALADTVTTAHDGWGSAVASIPRHQFVPAWWEPDAGGWALRTGRAAPGEWGDAAYADRTLVTRVGADHADHATAWDRPAGRPTSSATEPGLLLRMYQHARCGDRLHILDVGTGSGYGTALLAERYGDRWVTSVDVDPYLVDAARERLAGCGLLPRVEVVDATGPLPGEYDRIVASVAPPGIPASWVRALRTGGWLATTLADMPVIVTGRKTGRGFIVGRVEWDRAAFMAARSGVDYGAPLLPGDAGGGEETVGRYPVVDVVEAWELWGVHTAEVGPGVEHRFVRDGERRTASMVAPDGSWATATSAGAAHPVVVQGGPRRLWDVLDDIRERWLRDGSLHLYGARAVVRPDGVLELSRGGWRVSIPPAG